MRHCCNNFAAQFYQPGGGIGQTRFVVDGKCLEGDIAGSNTSRAAMQTLIMI